MTAPDPIEDILPGWGHLSPEQQAHVRAVVRAHALARSVAGDAPPSVAAFGELAIGARMALAQLCDDLEELASLAARLAERPDEPNDGPQTAD